MKTPSFLSSTWKESAIIALVVGGIVALTGFVVVGNKKPDAHTHQFGVWTNAGKNVFNSMWQERYCTNCGFYQSERH